MLKFGKGGDYMKQAIIIWNDLKTTTICGKYAFRIALNFLDKMGVFDRFSFFETADTYFFWDYEVGIEWIIKPRKAGN